MSNRFYTQVEPQKNVLAIHDISCIGRCSLTVALPILSACGIDTGILPTAILSTHTGGFSDYVVHDMSELLLPIATHLEKVALPFDAIYTGYLASADQADSVIEIFKKFPLALTFVDPAFADDGKLYPLMTQAIVEKFRVLIGYADVIVPNLTEALFLLGKNPNEHKEFSDDEMLALAKELATFGPKKVIITGFIQTNTMLTFLYDAEQNTHAIVPTDRYEGQFHGTGDCFASAILGCLLNHIPLMKSIEIATEFISRSIEKTLLGGDALRYGVRFEQVLPWLTQAIAREKCIE